MILWGTGSGYAERILVPDRESSREGLQILLVSRPGTRCLTHINKKDEIYENAKSSTSNLFVCNMAGRTTFILANQLKISYPPSKSQGIKTVEGRRGCGEDG